MHAAHSSGEDSSVAIPSDVDDPLAVFTRLIPRGYLCFELQDAFDELSEASQQVIVQEIEERFAGDKQAWIDYVWEETFKDTYGTEYSFRGDIPDEESSPVSTTIILYREGGAPLRGEPRKPVEITPRFLREDGNWVIDLQNPTEDFKKLVSAAQRPSPYHGADEGCAD